MPLLLLRLISRLQFVHLRTERTNSETRPQELKALDLIGEDPSLVNTLLSDPDIPSRISLVSTSLLYTLKTRVYHKGFSRSPQKLRGMGYNSDSTSSQDDLRHAMLNPSGMCVS